HPLTRGDAAGMLRIYWPLYPGAEGCRAFGLKSRVGVLRERERRGRRKASKRSEATKKPLVI
ncbi:MAG: hypothetical protein ACKO81_14900, partial [Planctomycetota bacterium]